MIGNNKDRIVCAKFLRRPFFGATTRDNQPLEIVDGPQIDQAAKPLGAVQSPLNFAVAVADKEDMRVKATARLEDPSAVGRQVDCVGTNFAAALTITSRC
jgi:hypothetical protein